VLSLSRFQIEVDWDQASPPAFSERTELIQKALQVNPTALHFHIRDVVSRFARVNYSALPLSSAVSADLARLASSSGLK
jgi:hypothetical protein